MILISQQEINSDIFYLSFFYCPECFRKKSTLLPFFCSSACKCPGSCDYAQPRLCTVHTPCMRSLYLKIKENDTVWGFTEGPGLAGHRRYAYHTPFAMHTCMYVPVYVCMYICTYQYMIVIYSTRCTIYYLKINIPINMFFALTHMKQHSTISPGMSNEYNV